MHNLITVIQDIYKTVIYRNCSDAFAILILPQEIYTPLVARQINPRVNKGYNSPGLLGVHGLLT